MTTDPTKTQDNQDPNSLPEDKLDALTAPDARSDSQPTTDPERQGTVQKTTLGTSSLEAPPSEPVVAVPRVGAPDPIPTDSVIEGLDGVSRGTLEEAAAEDARVREETDALLHGNTADQYPPVTNGDQHADGLVAPNHVEQQTVRDVEDRKAAE